MTGETELHGAVTLLSDQGDQRGAFVVVEVRGVLMPLIVPASCVESLGPIPETAARRPER